MSIISKQQVAKLSQIQGASCISIFIPTHRVASGEQIKKDSLQLKNELKALDKELSEQGFSDREIKKKLAPAEQLLDQPDFWNHQSDGLAIFLSNEFFQYFTLPIHFEAFHYLANGFYLKPLMPMFVGDGRFFLLAPELKAVNFYEGTRHSITEIHIDDLTPGRLEERVGYDYREGFLQFRSQQTGGGKAMFHGHGSGKEDRKKEIQKYFRAINDGLMTLLNEEDCPMVVASLDYLFPIYQEVNTYPHLLEEHVSGNPSDADVLLLHEKAWKVVQPHFDQERMSRMDQFQEFHGTGRTSTDIAEILPAAMDGRVATLFLRNRTDIWGVYDPGRREVLTREAQDTSNVSLMNLAAIQVFLQGGKVYLLEQEVMPDPMSKVNAFYRY